jgi:hypothetical protein
MNNQVAADWLNDGLSTINQKRYMMCMHLHARAVQDDLTRNQLKNVVREYCQMEGIAFIINDFSFALRRLVQYGQLVRDGVYYLDGDL